MIPNLLIMLLSLAVFFTKDNYQQLTFSFTAIVVVAVVSIEVKDFFPSFWTQNSWLDLFVIVSIIFMVIVTALSVVIIVLDESGCSKASEALDLAVSVVQPIAFAIISGLFYIEVPIAELQRRMTMLLIADVAVLFVFWQLALFSAPAFSLLRKLCLKPVPSALSAKRTDGPTRTKTSTLGSVVKEDTGVEASLVEASLVAQTTANAQVALLKELTELQKQILTQLEATRQGQAFVEEQILVKMLNEPKTAMPAAPRVASDGDPPADTATARKVRVRQRRSVDNHTAEGDGGRDASILHQRSNGAALNLDEPATSGAQARAPANLC